ncbi:hypothetical protein DM80_6073 [Burkholderia multivorans]|nr:hypothetical protein DM80_6073 [Burkholderia multivorans]GLZ73479.1 hypothetical protein Bcon01_65240 [Burkholderia contaminans]
MTAQPIEPGHAPLAGLSNQGAILPWASWSAKNRDGNRSPGTAYSQPARISVR